MTVEEWAKDFKAFVNELQMPRDDYKGIIAYIEDGTKLLKAQEPVEAVEMIDDFYPIGDPLRTIGWKCGKCMERIAGYDNYCPNCGQAVKWE